jgi:hypothetical protein
VPTDSVTVFGEKLKLSIATSVFVALTGADSLVWESSLCKKVSGNATTGLLKAARPTNIANARVPVFTCFRIGERTDVRLAVRF